MRRIVHWAVLGSFATVAATGCSDAFGVSDVVGSTWELTSVNGQAVPGWVEDAGGTGGMTRLPYVHYERWNFHRDPIGLESLACSIDYHYEDPTLGFDTSGTETCSYILDIEQARTASECFCPATRPPTPTPLACVTAATATAPIAAPHKAPVPSKPW